MNWLEREATVLGGGLTEGASHLAETTWQDAQKAAVALANKPIETSLAYLDNHKIDILAGAGIAAICGRSKLMNGALLAWSFNGLVVSGLNAVRDAADESLDLRSVKNDFANAVSHEGTSFIATLPAAHLGSKLGLAGRSAIGKIPHMHLSEAFKLPENQMVLAGAGGPNTKPGFFAMQAENNGKERAVFSSKKMEVKTENFATPETVNNPYLAEYKEAMLPVIKSRRSGNFREELDAEVAATKKRYQLVPKYGFAIHDSESLHAIVKAADGKPVVELGAGNGYLAHLLRQMGIKVTAYDKFPSKNGHNEWFRKDLKDWTEVIQGDENSLAGHHDDVLLLSWPDPSNPVASRALENFSGNKLVHIGEGYGGCTGDKKFYNILEKNWQRESTEAMLNWPGTRTMLEVYTRKRA